MRELHIAGPNRGSEAVNRAVSDLHSLLGIIESNRANDGSEDLFARDAHLWPDLTEYRRLDIKPPRLVAVGIALAARQNLGAFLFAAFNVVEDAVHLTP